MGSREEYYDQLRCVLSFLQDHFPDAAELVLKGLKVQEAEREQDPRGGEVGSPEEGSVDEEASSKERADHSSKERAKSAEAIVARWVF